MFAIEPLSDLDLHRAACRIVNRIVFSRNPPFAMPIAATSRARYMPSCEKN